MEQENKPKVSGSVGAGYALCILALFIFPPGLALAGFILGIVNSAKGESRHGPIQIVLSIFFGAIGMFLGALILSQ